MSISFGSMKIAWASFLLSSSVLLCSAERDEYGYLTRNLRSRRRAIPDIDVFRINTNSLIPTRDPTKPYIYEHGDLDPPSRPHFPPGGYIGYGLDMTQTSPLKISEVAGVVKNQYPILNLNNETHPYTLPGTKSKVIWNIPNNCKWDESNHNEFNGLTTYLNGSYAAEQLAQSDDAGGSYRCVKGDVSVSAALKKDLDDSRSWAFYAYVYDVTKVSIEDFLPWLNVPDLERTLGDLPKWVTGEDPAQDTIKKYRDVFNSIGTHVITAANYGSRFELRLSASNSDSEVSENFEVDVKVQLQGLASGGKFQSKTSGTKQYAEYEKTAHNEQWCRGGDATLCTVLGQTIGTNASYANLVAWIATAQDNPDLTSVTSTEIWSIFRSSSSETLKAYELSLLNAFDYFVEHPVTHYTDCSVIVTAAWGAVGMMSPGADIVNVQSIDESLGVLEISLDQLKFSTPSGQVAAGVRIQFQVRNRGTPFDIELTHSTGGYEGASVGIEFIAEPYSYKPFRVTNDITVPKDPYNRQEYTGVPADPRALATGIMSGGNTTSTSTSRNETTSSVESASSTMNGSAYISNGREPPLAVTTFATS